MRLVMQITKPNATIWNPTYAITEGDGPWPVFDHNGEEVGYVEWQRESPERGPAKFIDCDLRYLR